MNALSNNIKQVGVLQDFGTPFSFLYVDKENRQLYVFVRTSSPKNKEFTFDIAAVTPDEVTAYMNNSIGLRDMFCHKIAYEAKEVKGNRIKIIGKFDGCKTQIADSMDDFDSEFCYDDIFLQIFLKRLVDNKPLEI